MIHINMSDLANSWMKFMDKIEIFEAKLKKKLTFLIHQLVFGYLLTPVWLEIINVKWETEWSIEICWRANVYYFLMFSSRENTSKWERERTTFWLIYLIQFFNGQRTKYILTSTDRIENGIIRFDFHEVRQQRMYNKHRNNIVWCLFDGE